MTTKLEQYWIEVEYLDDLVGDLGRYYAQSGEFAQQLAIVNDLERELGRPLTRPILARGSAD